MNTLKMNHYAILVSFVLSFILGFLWYGPLFGEAWMRMVGLDEAIPARAGFYLRVQYRIMHS